jgi:hypothetical protein
MAIPITVFNPGQFDLRLTVNGGNLVDIPGTGPGQNWLPQQPNPNPFSFNNGAPAQNVFGTSATNQVQLFVARGPIGPPLLISIPQNSTVDSLQLYIFFWPGIVISWMLMSDGQPTTWNTIMLEPAVSSDSQDAVPC